jgi:hypothetical protein
MSCFAIPVNFFLLVLDLLCPGWTHVHMHLWRLDSGGVNCCVSCGKLGDGIMGIEHVLDLVGLAESGG